MRLFIAINIPDEVKAMEGQVKNNGVYPYYFIKLFSTKYVIKHRKHNRCKIMCFSRK